MDTSSFFNQVERFLLSAVLASIDDTVSEFHGESIYSLMFYPSCGFRNFAIAVSSRERIAESQPYSDFNDELIEILKEHPDLLEIAHENEISSNYYLLTACEWDYFTDNRFIELNKFLDANYDKLYDAGITPEKIEKFFATKIVSTIQRIKSEDHLNYSPFETDLFMGFQYSDTDNRSLMLDVSKSVNSDAWHRLALNEWSAG